MDKNFRIRLGLAFLFVLLLGLGVFGRAAHLMLATSERLDHALDRQFRNDAPKIPRRGSILDRNSEPIALSVKVKSLYANPGKIDNRGEVAYLLSRGMSLKSDQIREKLKKGKSFVWIKRHLTEEEASSVERLMHKHPILNVGVGLVEESKRFYPDQSLAAQIVGFVGIDGRGLEGTELFYNNELRGSIADKKVDDGKTLVLTIDKSIQYTLQSELEEGLKKSNAVSASGIVMNADTGDILAMASFPSYNLNQFKGASALQRRNRVITDTYEPGSTVKPLLVAGALAQGVIKPDTKIFCEYGKMKIGSHWVNEAETKDKWGWLKVGEVLQHSSNVGATKIGFLFGSMSLAEWYRKMGLTQKTGVDFPGEANGYLPEYKSWSKIMLSNISFGQGISVTPIQMIRAYAAFANGGYLVRPRLVRQWGSFEGDLEKEVSIAPPEKIMDATTVNSVVEMISKVATNEGTAPKAAIPGFQIVGKTGTAQKAYPGIGYKSGKYIATFVGFVRNVKPRLVTLVLVDEPKFPYFGGEAAAPIFRKVMSAALAREGVNPLLPIETPALANSKKQPINNITQAPISPAKPAELGGGEVLSMPNLIGASARDVMQVFSKRDVDVKIRGGGVVVEQFPQPGAPFRKGTSVSFRLSYGDDVP